VLVGVQALVAMGPERAGFLTLTFADHVTCAREAARRFHSFCTGWLSERAEGWIWVRERHKSGRWHYHLCVLWRVPIRGGWDRARVRARDYRAACPALRELWRELRWVCRRYRFGRHQLEPVERPEAAGAYLGKYLAKGERRPEDYGVRLIGAGGVGRQVLPSCQFVWVSGPSREWRVGMAYCSWAWLSCDPYEGDWRAQRWFRARFGPRWAWYCFRMLTEPLLLAASDWWEGR